MSAPSSPPAALTVATYNVYLGADLALLFGARSLEDLAARVDEVRTQLDTTRFEERAEALARILVREQVDVVGLQEVSRWTSGDEVLEDFLPVLLEALAATGCPYDAHAAIVSFEGGLPVDGEWMGVAGSNVVLVRREGPFAVTAERTGTYAASYQVVTGIEGVAFPIARSWGWVEGTVAGRPFLLANTHTEAYDASARDAQRNELLGLLGEVGCPVALVGDLNAHPSVVGVPKPFVDAWPAAGGDPEAGLTCGQAADLTNATSDLRERIDYVFVRDARVTDCRVVGHRPEDRTPRGLWPSDHAGVVARLEF